MTNSKNIVLSIISFTEKKNNLDPDPLHLTGVGSVSTFTGSWSTSMDCSYFESIRWLGKAIFDWIRWLTAYTVYWFIDLLIYWFIDLLGCYNWLNTMIYWYLIASKNSYLFSAWWLVMERWVKLVFSSPTLPISSPRNMCQR